MFVDEDDNAIMTIGPDGTLLAVDEPGELSDKEAKKYEERINDFNAGTRTMLLLMWPHLCQMKSLMMKRN